MYENHEVRGEKWILLSRRGSKVEENIKEKEEKTDPVQVTGEERRTENTHSILLLQEDVTQ